MQILRWASKLKAALEKYRLAFTDSKVIIGTIINLEAQISATWTTKAEWMMGFTELSRLLLIKQSRDRDVEIARLKDTLFKFEAVIKSLNALLKDVLAKTEDEDSLSSISPLEMVQMVQDSFYSMVKEVHIQKKIFNDYVMGIISIDELAKTWDDVTFIDFRIEQELAKRLKYL
jgi:hypothetical protein